MTRDLTTPTAPTPAAVVPAPAAPAARRRGWRRIAAVAMVAGPGLVAANAGNDAAGIATYASAAPSSPTARCSSWCWSPSPWSWSRRWPCGSAPTPARALAR
ncbi:hypothetical protein ACFQ1I_09500 [Kitasatospora arboriphila]